MNALWPRWILYLALALLYLLHNDLWLWHDERLVLGLPVGLTYHVLYCLATAVVMALLVRYAWPQDLVADDEAPGDTPRRGANVTT